MKNLIRIVFEIYLTRRKKSRLYLAYLLFSGLTKPMNSVLSKIKGPSIRVHGGGMGIFPFLYSGLPPFEIRPTRMTSHQGFPKMFDNKNAIIPENSPGKIDPTPFKI